MTERPTENLSYEQARDQLIDVVHKLESGGAPLAESLALWERGEQLASICEGHLDGAQAKVDAARNTGRPPASGGAEPPTVGAGRDPELATEVVSENDG